LCLPSADLNDTTDFIGLASHAANVVDTWGSCGERCHQLHHDCAQNLPQFRKKKA
jgi:hypothetical protein